MVYVCVFVLLLACVVVDCVWYVCVVDSFGCVVYAVTVYVVYLSVFKLLG